MTLKLTDPIIGKSFGTVEAAMDYARSVGAYDLEFLQEMFEELHRLAITYGFRFEYLTGQSKNETGAWSGKNPNWKNRHNPGGLAITNWENKSLKYTRGRDAARALVAHHYVYRYGPIPEDHELYAYRELDGHYNEVVEGINLKSLGGDGKPFANSVRTIGDFNVNGRWCLLDRNNTPTGPLNDYGNRILRDTIAVFGQLPDAQPFVPPTDTPKPTTTTWRSQLDGMCGAHCHIEARRWDGKTYQLFDPKALLEALAITTVPVEPGGNGEEPAMTLEILNRVIGVQGNAPATKLNVGPDELEAIIHNTDNPSRGADALMHAEFVKNGGGSGNVSFHFAVDSKRAVQILPLDRIGYHASDGCDSRAVDEGCFWGIAIENCDNADGDIAKTWDNLAELLACIEFGDARIDYGTMPKSYFKGFIDRLLGHQDVAFDKKRCPSDFITKYGSDWKTKLKALANAKLAAKRGTTPAPDPTEPTTPAGPIPVEGVAGVDMEMLAAWFGSVTVGSITYAFDRTGPVSMAWMANGKATGIWPKLETVDVYENGARKMYRFAGGLTIRFLKGQTPEVSVARA